MLSGKLVNQFLCISEILHSLPASPYVTVSRPFYAIMELPVASFRVEDPVNIRFFRVVDHCQLCFR
jgi:hypothetical protein